MVVVPVIFLSVIASLLGEDPEKIHKAGLLIDVNRFQEALAVYEEILRENTVSDEYLKSKIFNNMGFCHYKLNHADQAVLYYKRALELNGDYAICLNNLAAIYMNQKKYQNALPYLQRAYELGKENIKVVFNLFVVSCYLDKTDDASFYIREAFRIDEQYTEDRLRNKSIGSRDIERLKRYVRQ